MEDQVKKIAEYLRDGVYNTNPHEAAEAKATLAGEYSWIMGQLEQILQRKPAIWTELKRTAKSDKAAERMWEATSDGLNEMGLRLRAKGIEKMMSALSSLIKIAEGESNNSY